MSPQVLVGRNPLKPILQSVISIVVNCWKKYGVATVGLTPSFPTTSATCRAVSVKTTCMPGSAGKQESRHTHKKKRPRGADLLAWANLPRCREDVGFAFGVLRMSVRYVLPPVPRSPVSSVAGFSTILGDQKDRPWGPVETLTFCRALGAPM
jgi:hypothetical protein